MTKKIDLIVKEIVSKVKPCEIEVKKINSKLEKFLSELNAKIKKSKLKVEVFVGGSFAKKTLIRKEKYDIDIFLRFDKKYVDEDLSSLTRKILKGIKGLSEVHGSRDYFQVKGGEKLYFEIVPVREIKKPEEAKNITDLSYSHVKYVNKKIKKESVLDEIMVAKSFCHAKNCYGAESYIKGFSGYSLELLIIKYGTFEKFIREIAKNKEKLIVDIEKKFPNKQRVMIDLNESKLLSPIILIDPTYKQRNALAALSEETFERFKKDCKKFLKNPKVSAFEKEVKDLKKIKENALKSKKEFLLVEAKTLKDSGDVAGSKLLKFSKHFYGEASKFFEIKEKGFNYNDGKAARFFIVAERKKEIVSEGPNLNDKKNVALFKKKHKNTFKKGKRIFAKEKINLSVSEFFNKWSKKEKKKIKEMYISDLKVRV
jgi:tRNA nucleotidyltransferase (CCA-adding enzyme)